MIPVFGDHEVHVIASARLSLEVAAQRAEVLGVPAVILSDCIEGEARDVARVHAAIAREVASRSRPFPRPVVILSGGETTVRSRGAARAGAIRNFCCRWRSQARVFPLALAADTDGIDGSEDNAGAFADGASMKRLRASGADPAALLAGNDAWTAFHLLDDLFIPGPTGTNVNDFRAILIR